MFSLLLAIIYLSFISLGLPDSLLGAAWPSMYLDLGASPESAGFVTMSIALGTIISSLFSSKLTHKFGTGIVTAMSVAITALGLVGFSLSTSLPMLLCIALPFGLGAGAVDASLNNYVALHYSSKHMNWLHACWGVGATISPYIMSFALTGGLQWTGGYRIIAVIQGVICLLLFFSLSKWKRGGQTQTKKSKHVPIRSALKIRGVSFMLVAFLAYCGAEFAIGAYAPTYLVHVRDIPPETAAIFASFMFMGVTVGRFAGGFFAAKLGDRRMIFIGIAVLTVGIVMLLIPAQTDVIALSGLIVIGIGCAPIYPSIIHSTPHNFGDENSASIIGLEMASAYTGTTLLPPLFGFIATSMGMASFPYFVLILTCIMFVGVLLANRAIKRNARL